MPGAHKGFALAYILQIVEMYFFFKLYLCFWVESHLSGGSLGWN